MSVENKLFLLIFVFLCTSYFAKEKIKVEKTAKTFFGSMSNSVGETKTYDK